MTQYSKPTSMFISHLQLFVHFRHHIEQIADNSIVCNLEDRGFSVLIDGDNDLAILHSCQVLDGTGDSNGDVQTRSNDFTSLPNLEVISDKSGIDSRSGGTDGAFW